MRTGWILGATALVAVALLPPTVMAAPPGDPATTVPPSASATADLSEEARIAQGRNLYRNYCTRCHGLNMVSVGSAFFDLRTFPRDDKLRFVNSVTQGRRAMPAWGSQLSPVEIDYLWAYVSSYKP